MSDPLRHLRTLPQNTRLSSPSRLLFTALFAVIVGLFASPVAETWLLLPFTVVFATAAVVISLRQRRDGLRPNDYAPMRPDSETPRILGGTKSPESPETPDEKRQRYITYAAPVIYFLVIAGGWIPVEIGGWFWAGLVTIAVFSVCWKYFNLVDMVPLKYVPWRRSSPPKKTGPRSTTPRPSPPPSTPCRPSRTADRSGWTSCSMRSAHSGWTARASGRHSTPSPPVARRSPCGTESPMTRC